MADETNTSLAGSGVSNTSAPIVANRMSDYAREAALGFVASIALIANTISFATLLFPGTLNVGVPFAIWSMLIGSCIVGVWISLTTSISPLASGFDAATGAVLILLSTAVGTAVLADGGSPQTASTTMMLFLTAATAICGALFLAIGYFRWAAYLRFVPSFVVGGFFAATGWFLIAGGVQMATGHSLDASVLSTPWTASEILRLACTIGVLAILLALRQFVRSVIAVPIALLGMWVLGSATLAWFDLSEVKFGWYFPSLSHLNPWMPFSTLNAPDVHWRILTTSAPEMIAVILVATLSLVTKVSGFELTRQTSSDLDCEFRSHGIGNLIAAPAGGMFAGLQIGASRLLERADGGSRTSGVVCGLIMGFVALANFNLSGLIPIPVIGGLVFYLGYTFIMDAVTRPFAQRAWRDLLLALGIAIVCIKYGYLHGVLCGLIGACLLFAISYARVGVIRQSVSRSKYASNVERSPDASDYLRDAGDAIQLYWLSGYIFFGSSEGVLERICKDIDALAPGRVSYVILDFSMVSGADSSATVSLSKLKSFCDHRNVTIAYCALSPANLAVFEKGGFFGSNSRHQAFPSVNVALAWCEDRMLAEAAIATNTGSAGFESWLQRQLGTTAKASDLMPYLTKKEFEGATTLYDRGEQANSIELVAAGALVIEIQLAENSTLRRRRFETHTVIGEMGFFRRSVRSARVSTAGTATIFRLTRDNFERMQREQADIADAFCNFIICTLADRIEFSNREVAALSV